MVLDKLAAIQEHENEQKLLNEKLQSQITSQQQVIEQLENRLFKYEIKSSIEAKTSLEEASKQQPEVKGKHISVFWPNSIEDYSYMKDIIYAAEILAILTGNILTGISFTFTPHLDLHLKIETRLFFSNT